MHHGHKCSFLVLLTLPLLLSFLVSVLYCTVAIVTIAGVFLFFLFRCCLKPFLCFFFHFASEEGG